MQDPLIRLGPARTVVLTVSQSAETGYLSLVVRWHRADDRPPVEERYDDLSLDELWDVADAVLGGAEPF